MLFIEASLLFNFQVSKLLEQGGRFDAEPSFLHVFQQLKENGQRPIDPEYERVRRHYNVEYNRNLPLTNGLTDELAKQLQTAARNCIVVNMRARIRQWMKYRFTDEYLNHLPSRYRKMQWLNRHLDNLFHPTDSPRAEAIDAVRERLAEDLEVDVDFDFGALETERWWEFYPIAFRLQQFFVARGAEAMRSFKLCPIASHGHKHILFTARGFHELLKLLNLTKLTQFADFNTNGLPFEMAESLFNIEKWQKGRKRYAMAFSTDGVSVGIHMQRPVPAFVQSDEPLNDFQRYRMIENPEEPEQYVGVDPGRIRMCSMFNLDATDRRNAHSTFIWGSAIRSADKTHGLHKKQHLMTRGIENDQRTHANRVISKDATRYEEYTRFRLKWFIRKQKVYGRWKYTQLKWNLFMDRQKGLDLLAGDLLYGKRSIVFWGDGDRSVALGIRGHIRPPRARFMHAVRHHPKCIAVLLTHERYSTVKCARCLQFTRPYQLRGAQTTDPSQHFPRTRVRVCPHCTGRWGEGLVVNRDYNGAKNILMNAGLPLLDGNPNRLLQDPPPLPQ